MEEIIINQFLQSFANPLLNLFFQAITYLGHPAVWILIAAWLYWSGREKQSFLVISLILFSTVVSGALKLIVARPRPSGVLILEANSTYSMPSGHSTLIAAVYTFFKKKVTKYEHLLLLLVVLMVAVSRLYLGVHYLSDILVGLLIGYLIGKFFLVLEKRLEKTHFHLIKIKEELLVVLLFLVTIISLVALPNEFNGAQAIFGYYAGFVIHTHLKQQKNAKAKKLPKLFQKANLAPLGVGTLILLAIAAIGFMTTGITSQVVFFSMGLFITLIWPVILGKH